MEISSSNIGWSTQEQLKTRDPAVPSTSFHQQLQSVQEVGQASAKALPAATDRLLAARYNHNGEDVGFDELPADIQTWFREVDEKRALDEAYRAQVANDPNVGPVAKLRPFDPELDGWGMKRLAAMDPSTATMTPEQYYNYMGSDREKYDTLVAKAESPAYRAGARIFGADLEEESKVAMIQDMRAQGQSLPPTYGEFEQAWLSDLVRQQALVQERQRLLEIGQQS
jgi:hypothetical protein